MPVFLTAKLPLYLTLGLISLATATIGVKLLRQKRVEGTMAVEGMPEALEARMARALGILYLLLAAVFPVLLIGILVGLPIGDHILLPAWAGSAVVIAVLTLAVRNRFLRLMDEEGPSC